ncbi:Cas9 inhibitor AcrIIA9 family protein [Clostridium cochlearium]|uniref:Cas9 inhibitor AcrIIA9 family protein n=1 Tax=Clostridium cochlearium TaxID=1494 RepID=UPI0017E06E23|nr:Cas9 inhibitor AcrIIA9 family protein [Clostridium cochlearium]NMA58830.1 hypothetical protein [Clostridium cochlearium]
MSQENTNKIEKAREKIEKEQKKFREETQKLKPENIYNMAGVIIFTEATVYHLRELTLNEELCDLILKDDKTLEGAINHIMSKVRLKYGQMGDLPVEEFHELIWDYYKIDPNVIKEAVKEKEEKEMARKQNIKIVKTSTVKKSMPKAGPLQVSLFNM